MSFVLLGHKKLEWIFFLVILPNIQITYFVYVIVFSLHICVLCKKFHRLLCQPWWRIFFCTLAKPHNWTLRKRPQTKLHWERWYVLLARYFWQFNTVNLAICCYEGQCKFKKYTFDILTFSGFVCHEICIATFFSRKPPILTPEWQAKEFTNSQILSCRKIRKFCLR